MDAGVVTIREAKKIKKIMGDKDDFAEPSPDSTIDCVVRGNLEKGEQRPDSLLPTPCLLSLYFER